MDSNESTQVLFENSVRIERMFWLPGLGHEPPDDFEEFCSDYEPAQFTGALPPRILGYLKDDDLDDRERAAIVAETLTANAVPGFLVQLATPVREPRPNGSYSYSWGHYFTTWVYAETTDALVEKAVAWAEERATASQKKRTAKESPHDRK